ncbi:MAG: protein kinase domain-containing protein [Nannocystales bacterium]
MGVRIASDTRPVQVSGSSNEGQAWSRLARNELIPGSRYLLKRWIGEGGMGVIYEAEHVDVKRPVAVKILRPEYATNLNVIEAFRFEARATSDLDSPYLVKIHDYFELPDGRSALVMELLDGRDLSRREESVMPSERVLGIARQVCKALQLVHASGVVHRDLKPENIFLCEGEDRPDTIRVLDFGIARLSAQATSAQSGGTPLYTAPEVVLGGAQGPGADVYALGCVLYELLTGITAFGRDTVDETLQAHLESPPPAPSSHCPDIHPMLDAVVLRAIAREPRTRYADMASFEAALCEAQIAAGISTSWDDLPIPNEIPAEQREQLLAGMPDPTNRRRSRVSPWAAVLAAVALTGIGVFAITRPETDPSQALSPEQIQANSLAREARTAGSRAAWVYPPPDDISARTAYQAVLALEELGTVGTSIATELRTDFSITLIRLGDEYWDAEGGTRFAIAYYEQALLFDRTSLHALERSSMALPSIDAFGVRAANSQFALEELVRVEPLVELAVEDEAPPAERIKKVRRTRRVAQTSTPTRRDAAADTPDPEAQPGSHPGNGSPSRQGQEAAVDEADDRDPEAGKALAKQGQGAAKSGSAGKAKLLFERALAKDSRNASAHAGLRDLAFSAGDYARAVRHGKRAVALAPRNATHQLRLGDAYYRTHKYVKAESAYAAASRLGDERAKWRLERAREKLGG